MSRVSNRGEEDEQEGGGEVPGAHLVRGWGETASMDVLVDAVRKTPLCFAAFFSKRRGSKSHLLKCLLHRLVSERVIRLDSLLVCSATASLNSAYSWVPQNQVVSEISEDKLAQILQFQIDRVTQAGSRARKTGRAQQAPGLVLVLDDVASAIDLMHSPSFKYIAMNGRHCKLTVFALCQQVKGMMHPAVRSNLDFVLTGVLSHSQQRAVHELTVGMPFKSFSGLLAQMPSHSFLMYSNVAQMPHERWSLVRAPAELPRFRLGRPPSRKSLLAKDKRQADQRRREREQAQKPHQNG
jgi:hypothetical protein